MSGEGEAPVPRVATMFIKKSLDSNKLLFPTNNYET